jgi:hypothetical protein
MVATDPGASLRVMDGDLKVLADASLAVEAAEAAAGDGALLAAREALDDAERGLDALRVRWPAMGPAERAVIGRAAAEVSRRADGLARRLPRAVALGHAPIEHDPEQDLDPAAAA